MSERTTGQVWAVCLLGACISVAAAEASAAEPSVTACFVSPSPVAAPSGRQDHAAARAGRIPGLGNIKATVDWDNRMQLTLAGAGFEVARSYTPLTREVQLTVSGPGEEPLVIRFGGTDGLTVSRGARVIRGLADADARRALLGGRAIASFRERVGNYERQLITLGAATRVDNAHADGFLLAGAFIASMAGDTTAVGRARDLILQRVRSRMQAVRFDFRDCVTGYERYLLQIDTQRTNCIDAANDRDSWYVRAADRLGCEAEFIGQALAGEGQFLSCTALGSVLS